MGLRVCAPRILQDTLLILEVCAGVFLFLFPLPQTLLTSYSSLFFLQTFARQPVFISQRKSFLGIQQGSASANAMCSPQKPKFIAVYIYSPIGLCVAEVMQNQEEDEHFQPYSRTSCAAGNCVGCQNNNNHFIQMQFCYKSAH